MNNRYFYQNPVLSGFYPDPSMCRVGDDYYLAASTFAYFPGVPIFHSQDLVHWEQIGNILDRPSQLPLKNAGVSQGIFAPTLRYHEGTFYMITTNVSSALGNFIVTAKDPAGPWSEPYSLGSEGIDPSLFFDDDGKCYYCGTKPRREGARYFGDNEIYIQELDLDTMKLVGESYPAWHGALRDVEWPEGPHIYKKDGWYYLLISEAGTAHDHAISIARSKNLSEPFEGCKANPIMTHRHLGLAYPIVNVGHPDIVETKNGEWWMILLASRPYGGYYRNLGRETFLVPMAWENGWPIVCPGKGIVETTLEAPDLPLYFTEPVPATEHFDRESLPLHFMYLRNPVTENYSLTDKKGYLALRCAKDNLSSSGNPSYVCQRQRDFNFRFETAMEFSPASERDQAGIAIFQCENSNYQFLAGTDGSTTVLSVIRTWKDETTLLESISLESICRRLTLRLEARLQDLSFQYSTDGKTYSTIVDHAEGRILCTDATGGFVGNTLGVYATSNGEDSDTFAYFDRITYIGI